MDNELRQPLSIWDKISYLSIWVGVIGALFITYPILNFSSDLSKKFFVVLALAVAVVSWAIGQWSRRTITLPRNYILPFSGILVFAFFVASIFSPTIHRSLVGFGFDNGTAVAMLIFWLILFLFSVLGQSKRRFFNFYLALLSTFALMVVFQAARYAFGNFTPWGIFDYGSANLVGKWNEFGILAGFVVLSSYLLLEFFTWRGVGWIKYFLAGSFVLGLGVLFLVNFLPIWIILAIAAGLGFLYYLSFVVRKKEITGIWLRPSLVLLVIASAFIIFGRPINPLVVGSQPGILAQWSNQVADKLNIQAVEVRPSWSGTYAVGLSSLKDNWLLGVGPNNFVKSWLLNKPAGVNDTQFWNIDLNNGYGALPTYVITTGLLGLIAIVLLLLSIAYYGIRGVFFARLEALDKSFVILVFSGVAYLWTLSALYVPETAILVLTFALTGLLISTMDAVGLTKGYEVDWLAVPRRRFLVSLILGIITLSGLGLGYLGLTNILAIADFQRSVVSLRAKNDPAEAYAFIKSAMRYNPQDLYSRAAVEINLAQMSKLLATPMSQEKLLKGYMELFAEAKKNGDAAVAMDKTNYLNYQTLAGIYESMLTLNIPGSYDVARQRYQEALRYNPHSPALYLDLARLELAHRDYAAAQKYLNLALTEKRDYLDAIMLQAQLLANRGDLGTAVARSREAAKLNPDNLGALFQLGYFSYRYGDYRGAIEAFQQALSINRDYSNAKYFLGLSYSKSGDQTNALMQFLELARLNPGNQEVAQIVANLQAGRGPFDNAPVKTTTAKTKTKSR